MARHTSPLAALRRLLARSQRPIYVLDEMRTLVFANEALAQWVGVSLDDLIGIRCNYSAGGEHSSASLAAALCPPPESLFNPPSRLVVQAPVADQWRRRQAAAISWDHQHQLQAVLILLDDRDLEADEQGQSDRCEQLHQQVVRLRAQLPTYSTFFLLGDSAVMRRVRQQVEAASATEASVLLVGPDGAGREEVAKSIFYGGDTSKGILPLSCPLLNAELLANALEDLQRSQHELVETPNTILLLDVDQMALGSQAALYDRLLRLDPSPRLLATSAGRLQDSQSFHTELALHLSGIVVELPALVDRREDIPQLVQLVIQDHNANGGSQLSGVESDAMDLLLLYPWFDNLDELQSLVHQACQRALSAKVQTVDLPESLHAARQQAAHPPRQEEPIDLPAFLEQIERELIQRAMAQAKGNKAQAARMLGLRRSRLLRRLEALKLVEPSLNPEPEDDIEFDPVPPDDDT